MPKRSKFLTRRPSRLSSWSPRRTRRTSNCLNSSQLSSRTGSISNGRQRIVNLSQTQSFQPILTIMEAINNNLCLHKTTQIIKTSISSNSSRTLTAHSNSSRTLTALSNINRPINNSLLALPLRSERSLPNQSIPPILGANRQHRHQAMLRSHLRHLSRTLTQVTENRRHHMEDSSQREAMGQVLVTTVARATSTVVLHLTSM